MIFDVNIRKQTVIKSYGAKSQFTKKAIERNFMISDAFCML